MRSQHPKSLLVAVAITALALPVGVRAQDGDPEAQVILDWNQHALETIDASPAAGNLFMGMVHGAMYDAVVSIVGGYQPYLGALEVDPTASAVAAAAAAAHDVLASTFPDRAADLQGFLDASLADVPEGTARDAGVAVGKAAAAAMIAARAGDGRDVPNPLTFGDGPGEYRPTPPDFAEFPDSWLAKVKPFLADSAEYYRTAGPRALDSTEYAAEFNEVKSSGALVGSTRTDEQNAIAGFWGGAVPQWSAIERSIATEQGLDIAQAARLFAIANLGAADAAIGCFDDKYHWMFWRPITAIHEAASDGNPATEPDPDWVDLAEGAPPYPDHPSGFNCFAGAHAGALQEFFETDEMAFQASVEGVPTRSYTAFSQALDEIIDVRVLHGLHFRSADEQGAALGQKAAALAAERLAATE